MHKGYDYNILPPMGQPLSTSLFAGHRTLRRNPVSLLPKNYTAKGFRNSKAGCHSKNVLMFKDTFFLFN